MNVGVHVCVLCALNILLCTCFLRFAVSGPIQPLFPTLQDSLHPSASMSSSPVPSQRQMTGAQVREAFIRYFESKEGLGACVYMWFCVRPSICICVCVCAHGHMATQSQCPCVQRLDDEGYPFVLFCVG